MSKSLLYAAALVAASLSLPSQAAQLTAQESRWLRAAAPVLDYSKSIDMPVDIIVQPQAAAGAVPLAMGFAKGRCKLVLSMRGNPDAEKVLDKVPLADQALLIEAMAAHELAHCWRYAQGEWHLLPAGFVETGNETSHDPALLAAAKAMRDTRREEGFADLVALAWIQRTQPGEYARVHDWLSGVRGAVAVPHSGHDTRAWVKLAGNGKQFDSRLTPFEAADALWREGLLHGD
ncbi:hypothetical protein [Telluria beijingensis]|uniref:hypothetical protein n=1 Tax=Telluria beijingensis TaxID=3068633 RepID=UPI002795EFA7|nr:hypothetical protein [Massilia sp. REN29]